MSRSQLLLQVFEATRACNEHLADMINVHLSLQPDMLVVLRGGGAARMPALRQEFERNGWDLLQFDQRVIPTPEPVKLRRLAVSICGAAGAAVDCGSGDRATALLAVAADRIRRIRAQWRLGDWTFALDACGHVADPLLAVVATDLGALGGAWGRVCTEFACALGNEVYLGCAYLSMELDPDRNLHQFI